MSNNNTQDNKPAQGKTPLSREERLAKELRANLKKRKTLMRKTRKTDDST